MAFRPQDKVSERELSDVVVDKLNYLGNLKLTENIVVKGNHGSFTNGEVLTKGTRVSDIIQGILDDTYQRPYNFPVLELNGVQEDIEVGNTVSITLVPTFTQNDAGKLTRFRLEKSVSSGSYVELYDTDHIVTYTEQDISIIDNPNIVSFKATVWFEEGNIKTLNGQEVKGHIEADSISTVLTISGIRKCFYGAEIGVKFAVQNSNQVRALPNSTPFAVEAGTMVPITIQQDTTRITFAYPANIRDIQKITSKKLGYDIKDVFEKSTIRVKGANNYTDTEYKVYTYIPDAAYPTDDIYTFEI